jgi:hypothetical protein
MGNRPDDIRSRIRVIETQIAGLAPHFRGPLRGTVTRQLRVGMLGEYEWLDRVGAESVVRRIRRVYPDRLEASLASLKELLYLQKCKDNLRYG